MFLYYFSSLFLILFHPHQVPRERHSQSEFFMLFFCRDSIIILCLRFKSHFQTKDALCLFLELEREGGGRVWEDQCCSLFACIWIYIHTIFPVSLSAICNWAICTYFLFSHTYRHLFFRLKACAMLLQRLLSRIARLFFSSYCGTPVCLYRTYLFPWQTCFMWYIHY